MSYVISRIRKMPMLFNHEFIITLNNVSHILISTVTFSTTPRILNGFTLINTTLIYPQDGVSINIYYAGTTQYYEGHQDSDETEDFIGMVCNGYHTDLINNIVHDIVSATMFLLNQLL